MFEFLPGAYVLTNHHEPGTVAVPEAAWPRPEESLAETVRACGRVAADSEMRLPGGLPSSSAPGGAGTVCSAILAPPHFALRVGAARRGPRLEVVPGYPAPVATPP